MRLQEGQDKHKPTVYHEMHTGETMGIQYLFHRTICLSILEQRHKKWNMDDIEGAGKWTGISMLIYDGKKIKEKYQNGETSEVLSIDRNIR